MGGIWDDAGRKKGQGKLEDFHYSISSRRLTKTSSLTRRDAPTIYGKCTLLSLPCFLLLRSIATFVWNSHAGRVERHLGRIRGILSTDH